MKHAGCLIMVLVLCLLAPPGTGRADSPIPHRKTGDLESLEKKLLEEEENKKELQARMEQAEKDMTKIREELIDAATLTRRQQRVLINLEDEIAGLAHKEDMLKFELQNDHKALSEMMLAMTRLRRVPPETLIVRPGAPLKTAQTAMLLRHILPALHQRMAQAAQNLKDLDETRADLREERQRAVTAQEDLDKKYAKVKKLADRREEIFRSLNVNYKATELEINRISKEARSMQDFLERLNKQEEKRKAEAKRSASSGSGISILKSWSLPREGQPQLPVPGIIVTSYGEKDEIGAISEGLKIRADPRTLAVAPMGGIVRFVGTFKNFGRLVILEHQKNRHSLIGGLEDINVSPGQSLEAGEPLGKLPGPPSPGQKPTLYYELRYNGRPVNPSKVFPGLKS